MTKPVRGCSTEITELPEYYLTRTEREIFAERAAEIIHAGGGKEGGCASWNWAPARQTRRGCC